MAALKPRILYADENPNNCEFMMRDLVDYEVTCAATAADSLRQATANGFDLTRPVAAVQSVPPCHLGRSGNCVYTFDKLDCRPTNSPLSRLLNESSEKEQANLYSGLVVR